MRGAGAGTSGGTGPETEGRQTQAAVRSEWADGGGLLHLITGDIEVHEHESPPDEQENKQETYAGTPVAMGVTGSPQAGLASLSPRVPAGGQCAAMRAGAGTGITGMRCGEGQGERGYLKGVMVGMAGTSPGQAGGREGSVGDTGTPTGESESGVVVAPTWHLAMMTEL